MVSCLYTVMIYIFTEVDEDCVLVGGELAQQVAVRGVRDVLSARSSIVQFVLLHQ